MGVDCVITGLDKAMFISGARGASEHVRST
jgi:hypothetical protein